jgi:CheY-like chemotaxis protein
MNLSVLIVEDAADLADMEANLVIASGGRPTVVLDGGDALAALRRTNYGLILLDLSLPRVDGQAVLDYLVGDETLNRIPVIVVSGEIERLRPTPQVVAVFEKPFGPLDLGDAIRAILGSDGLPSDFEWEDTDVEWEETEERSEFDTMLLGP